MAAGATPFNTGGVSLRFPADLGTDEVPNYVTFRPEMVDFGTVKGQSTKENYGNAFTKPDFFEFPSSIQKAFKGGININNPFEQIQKEIGGFVDTIAKKAKLDFDFPGNIGNVKFDLGNLGNKNAITGRLNLGSLNIDLGNFSKLTPTTVKRLPGINLYLPPEIKSALSAKYNQQDITAAGQTAIDIASNPMSASSEYAVDTISNLATAAISEIMNDKFSNVFQRASGRAKNNYSYAIFNGMNHRKFEYKFRLIAKNAQETKAIKSICDSFMFYMLPVKAKDDFHFYDVPCMWDISYNRLGSKISYFDQPRKCFLENASVTYGNDAFGHTYNDGAPITVDLSLSFMEIEPLLRTDGDVDGISNPLLDQFENLFKTETDVQSSGGGGK